MGGTWEQETPHAGPLTTAPPSPLFSSSEPLTQAVAKLQKLRKKGKAGAVRSTVL